MAFLGSIGKFFSKGPGAILFPPAAISIGAIRALSGHAPGGLTRLFPFAAGAGIGALLGGGTGAFIGGSLARSFLQTTPVASPQFTGGTVIVQGSPSVLGGPALNTGGAFDISQGVDSWQTDSTHFPTPQPSLTRSQLTLARSALRATDQEVY